MIGNLTTAFKGTKGNVMCRRALVNFNTKRIWEAQTGEEEGVQRGNITILFLLRFGPISTNHRRQP